jgi:hypothetical protein
MEALIKRKFTDLLTGRIVEVTDQFEDIVILDNKNKIKLNKLMDNNFYDEFIDPKNFFRNEGLVSAFTEKIRQIPTENIKNEQDRFDPKNPPVLKNYGDPMRPSFDEPAVLPYDPEEEKQQLIAKAKAMMNKNIDTSVNQMETFKSLLEEDIDEIPIPINEDFNSRQVNTVVQPPQTRHPDNIMINNIDPIVQMFRNAKRNTDFKISFTINNKIPRLDFIEMMEDSYNTSIIDFLAEEFTNELLLNPELIKNKIKDQISSMVYKTTQPKKEEPLVKKTTRKKISNNAND